MTLHTVNLLPDHADCERCISQLASADAVVFLGNGAWITAVAGGWHEKWDHAGVALYVLDDDLVARGLSEHCARSITIIDVAELVALTEQHSRLRAWF